MKKWVIVLMSAFLAMSAVSVAFAEDQGIAKLKMNITSQMNEKPYALCISEVCYPLFQKHKMIPIEAGKVKSVIMTDMSNMMMHFQKLPASCQVNVNSNQTLVVSGHMTQKNQAIVLNNLRCSVL